MTEKEIKREYPLVFKRYGKKTETAAKQMAEMQFHKVEPDTINSVLCNLEEDMKESRVKVDEAAELEKDKIESEDSGIDVDIFLAMQK